MPVGSPLAGLLAAAGAGGGADLYVGSFAPISSTGTQAVTGVGFTPKAILFWTSGSDEASGSWNTYIRQMIGFTSGPTESYAVTGSSVDGASTSQTARRIAAKAITYVQVSASASEGEADLDSFDSDGFTLDWTEAVSPGTDNEIMFLAIGGADVSAKVVQWTSPTSNGNRAVTGVGFEPDLVMNFHATYLSAPFSTTGFDLNLGVMDGSGNQWATAVTSADGRATSDTARYQATDKCLTYMRNGEGGGASIGEEAEYVSMDSDGFTVNFTTTNINDRDCVSLCLSGLDAKVGNFAKTTSGAPASQAVTGVGFEPGAVLLSSVNSTGFTLTSHAIWNLGAGDGTNERATAQVDRDNTSTTEADSIWKNDKVIVQGGLFNSISSEAELSSLDSDGFTLNWTTNSGSSDIPYIALA